MKASCVLTNIFCAIWLCSSPAFAQRIDAPEGQNHAGRAAGDIGNPSPPHYADRAPLYSVPTIYSHSSTFEEGVARGMADYARGLGDMEYSLSAARLNNQAAINYYLDNRREALETYLNYLQTREYLREYRRRPRPTRAQVEELAKNRAPDPLSDEEFDSSTGTLFWPPIFQNSSFANERSTLDFLFAQRKRWPRDSGRGTENARAIRESVAAMMSILKDRIDDVTPEEYVAAKKFLTAVELESQKQAGTQDRFYNTSSN